MDLDDARSISQVLPTPARLDVILARLFGARVYDLDQAKLATRVVNAFAMLGSIEFTAWLADLTGIPDLRIDDKFVGAGLHQAVNGSILPIHADHNTHPDNEALYRRVNILIYMNPIWKLEWGGILELWDRAGSQCRELIMPILNRCVIMEVHDSAFHGYQTIRAARGVTRSVLAAYYYSALPSPDQVPEPHPTIFADAGRSNWTTYVRRARHSALLRVRGITKKRSQSR